MKLKTFFVSYLLFLSILFAALSIVSVYLTGHQMTNLREQSSLEYERIVGAIEREVNALYDRGESELVINMLIESHINIHRRQGISLLVERTGVVDPIVIIFNANDEAYTMGVSGTATTAAGDFQVEVVITVTSQIVALHETQQVFLILFVTFSLVAAIILYIVLNKIFKPLELVARSTKKIAEGDYSERINIKGTNELALMANNFNQMADVVEKHIAELEDEAERKQQFIDNLAHELRTPLTSIYGYAEYMQKGKLTETDKLESATIIMEESDYMRQITNSMLELAKLRNFIPEKQEINIAELFDQITATLEMTFKAYKVKWVTQPADASIQGQSDLIKSMLTNLCINAAKACASDKGEVILKATLIGKQVEISVIDNGCGIDKENVARLIEPFYQVDAARNKSRGGVGLGLAIVKQIADIHDAKIEIESEINNGTEVKVTFQ